MSTTYVYPPTSVAVAFPPGAASETTLLEVAAYLEEIRDLTEDLLQSQQLDVLSMASLSFASTNVDNSAWVELLTDSGAAQIKKVQIFMSSGEPLLLGFGAAASEVAKMIIIPGGNGIIEIEIPVNTRLSLKAVNAVTVSEGVILVNLLG